MTRNGKGSPKSAETRHTVFLVHSTAASAHIAHGLFVLATSCCNPRRRLWRQLAWSVSLFYSMSLIGSDPPIHHTYQEALTSDHVLNTPGTVSATLLVLPVPVFLVVAVIAVADDRGLLPACLHHRYQASLMPTRIRRCQWRRGRAEMQLGVSHGGLGSTSQATLVADTRLARLSASLTCESYWAEG